MQHLEVLAEPRHHVVSIKLLALDEDRLDAGAVIVGLGLAKFSNITDNDARRENLRDNVHAYRLQGLDLLADKAKIRGDLDD